MPSCAAQGDEQCVYFLRWRPISSLAPLLAGVFVGAAVATAHVMRRHPQASRLLAPLAVATLSLLGLRLDLTVGYWQLRG